MHLELQDAIRHVQRLYPQIWFACHRHRVRAEAGLSDRQSQVLTHLEAAGARSPKALATHLRIAISTLSEAAHALIERDLVRRETDPDDKRRASFQLTEKGLRYMRDSSPLDANTLGQALETLSATERDTVIRGLALLAGALRP